MGKTKVAINGFGRIGRLTFKAMLNASNIEVVAINDLTNVQTLAHLLKYDSVHGRFSGSIFCEDNYLVVDGKRIKILEIKEPEKLPWNELGVDIVLESTGKFTSDDTAGMHIKAGAKRIVISAPAKGNVKTIVIGVNDHDLTAQDIIVSNASCTTNCLAPMIKVLDDKWGVESGFMTTVHAYTSDQRLHDMPHKDLRRSRAAAASIVPTSTGAAKAIGLVIPHLKGKIDGAAMRVPVIDGSITDVSCILKNKTTKEEINRTFKETASLMKGILEYTEDPIVSADIIGNTHSCIFDAGLTIVNDKLVKVVGWYDNETGYSHRIKDLIQKVAVLLNKKPASKVAV